MDDDRRNDFTKREEIFSSSKANAIKIIISPGVYTWPVNQLITRLHRVAALKLLFLFKHCRPNSNSLQLGLPLFVVAALLCAKIQSGQVSGAAAISNELVGRLVSRLLLPHRATTGCATHP